MTEESDTNKVVLIVDPDGVASGALGRSLRRLGCEPQSCWDMHAALIAARAERPALVIASSELLDGDGFMLCDHLRADANLAGLPVVLLCDESATATVEQHRASPTKADAYLFRPLSVTAILQRVGKYLTGESGPESADDDELSLNSAVEVIEPEKRKPPPPPKKSAMPPASVAPPPHESVVPPPPRLPQIDIPAEHHSEPPPPVAPVAKSGSIFPPRTTKSVFPSATPSMRAAGMSSRDFLDLREQLNAKDRELHKLREDFHAAEARHNEVLERVEGLRAANLELLDKIRERDEALGGTATLLQQLDAARADKDLAHKRAQTFLAKIERAKQDSEKHDEHIAAEREKTRALAAVHAAELEKIEIKHREELAAMFEKSERYSFDAVQTVRTELEEAHAREAGELRQKVASAEEDRARALAEQKAAHDAELQKERERADRDIDVANTRTIRDVANAREEVETRAAADKAAALDALRAELNAETEKKLAEQRATLEADLKSAHEKELAGERARAETEALQALAQHESELRAEFDKRYAELRATLEAEAAAAMTAAEDRHARVLAELEAARAATLKKEREEIERALRAEKDAALEEARQAADAELKALEKMTDLQLADMMRERNRAREDAENNAAAERARVVELEALKKDHENALAGLRADHERAFATSAEKLSNVEKVLADEIARREAAEQRLSRDREILSRARDSLAEAMRGVDIARDPEQKA